MEFEGSPSSQTTGQTPAGAILTSQAVLLLLIPAHLPLEKDPEAKGRKGTLPPEGIQSNTTTK